MWDRFRHKKRLDGLMWLGMIGTPSHLREIAAVHACHTTSGRILLSTDGPMDHSRRTFWKWGPGAALLVYVSAKMLRVAQAPC